jgi:hypothetical protein
MKINSVLSITKVSSSPVEHVFKGLVVGRSNGWPFCDTNEVLCALVSHTAVHLQDALAHLLIAAFLVVTSTRI